MLKQNQIVMLLGSLSMVLSVSTFAAKPIDLKHQSASVLQSFIALRGNAPQSHLKTISTHLDFNQTAHIRLQQTYAGYPVWGGDAVVHIPHSHTPALLASALQNKQASMNGTLYQDLAVDLAHTPTIALTPAQADKALSQAIALHEKKVGYTVNAMQPQTKIIVYLDQSKMAHYAFLVSFTVKAANTRPVRPTFILDAATLHMYRVWDDIKTLDMVAGSGLGGNKKMGQLVFAGDKKLFVSRDPVAKMCFLKNADVTVVNMRHDDEVVQYRCDKPNKTYAQTYWDGQLDRVNGAFSPSNDALYAGYVVKNMYQQWYGVPVLTIEDDVTQTKQPMMLVMRVHDNEENAYWDGRSMTFGDGGSHLYPLTSLGIAAHEVSHGFTEQHAQLIYYGQSGGLNEAFSDMAAQAAEFFSTGQSSWMIGAEVMKDNSAIRYMDNPPRDCIGLPSGSMCSIDHVKDYADSIDVHYTSGVYNKLFYLLSTSSGWDTRKAFDVMVKANTDYWTADTSFAEAACGVVSATLDHGYNVAAVKAAFKKVGIDTGSC